MPVCVVIHGSNLEEKDVDDSPMSPYVHDILGDSPQILGAWDDSRIVLLGTKNPVKNEVTRIPEDLLPSSNREEGILYGPVMITRLNDSYIPINFTTKDLQELLQQSNCR